MRKMTIGSLFDGSGGFPLAGCMCGMEPLWASEIEPYPIAVTKARFPKMKHLGDVQKINGAEIEPVDVITFGSPCQDMSVAGKRAGLMHEGNGDDHTTRSGMFIEAIRIIREMREATNGKYPAFAVWENVPGAFSSNGGADFKTVLEELASVAQGERVCVPFPEKRRWLNAGEIVGDGYSIAWRVLDAQYWGVPQRRKRIYLVADFAGGRAGKILFERESGGGNPEPGKEVRQGAADHVAGGAGRSDRVECLTTAVQTVAGFIADTGAKSISIGYAENLSPTLCASKSGQSVVYDTSHAQTTNPQPGDLSHTLAAQQHTPICVRDFAAVCIGNGQMHNISMAEHSNTLDCMHDRQAILTNGKPPRRYIVRRLTPLECCRLQGFPDGWGDIPRLEIMTDADAKFWEDVRRTYAGVMGKAYRQFKCRDALVKWYNKLHTDSAEYKMWGNGIALPCAVFVMQGIAECVSAME